MKIPASGRSVATFGALFVFADRNVAWGFGDNWDMVLFLGVVGVEAYVEEREMEALRSYVRVLWGQDGSVPEAVVPDHCIKVGPCA